MGVKKMQGEAMNFTSYNPWPKIYFFFFFSRVVSLLNCAEETRMRKEGGRKFVEKKGFIFQKKKN
jgi:hypothetical protein